MKMENPWEHEAWKIYNGETWKMKKGKTISSGGSPNSRKDLHGVDGNERAYLSYSI